MTLEDGYRSYPRGGVIAYRLPAVWDLLGKHKYELDRIGSLDFTLSLIAHHEGEDRTLSCQEASRCKISYVRMYTPAIQHI